MSIGKLPQSLAPTRSSSLPAAPNPRHVPRTPFGGTMHAITNAPRFPTGRVSSLIRLYDGGAADQKQVATAPRWAAVMERSPSVSSAPASAYSSGYASRSSSVCSEAPPLGERLRDALDQHLSARLDTFDAGSDFLETYSAEELTAMDQRFSAEEQDIARADRAFEANHTAPLGERLRAALDQRPADPEGDSGVGSDFDEHYSDEEMAAFSTRFEVEGQDIERADRAFTAQRLGHAPPDMTEQYVNAVRAQLMDVLNRFDNETYL
jgi:hypothetical protein